MTELWYYKQYNNLIKKGLDRQNSNNYVFSENIKFEKHHILPKCMGGKNEKSNYVYLTTKEHIWAHIFLSKAYPDNNKLLMSAHCMTTVCNKYTLDRSKVKLSIRLLSELRDKSHPKGKDSPNYGKKASEETKKKLSISKSGEKHPMFGKKVSEKTKQLMSESRKGEKNGFFGKHHTEESKKLISEHRKGVIPNFSEEAKIKFSERWKGEKNPRYGYKYSEEERKELSLKRKGKPLSAKAYKSLIESRKKYMTGGNNPSSKRIEGPDGTIYPTVKEAAKSIGINRTHVKEWINKHPEKGYKYLD